jgi:hypothetical protein
LIDAQVHPPEFDASECRRGMLWLVLLQQNKAQFARWSALPFPAKKAERIVLWPHFFAFAGAKR